MRHNYITPYGPYLAGDGKYVNLAVASASDWDLFCGQVVERPDLHADPRFATAELRRKNRAVLEEEIETIFLAKPHDEWLRRLAAARLPHGRVNGIGEVLAHPQVLARKFIREIASPVGAVPVLGNPLRLSASSERFDRIPALGEDTEAILSELGYSASDIATLRSSGAI
jgi:itaconate CoA-transferase